MSITTQAGMIAAEVATHSASANLIAACAQLTNFSIPAETMDQAVSTYVALSRVNADFVPLQADVASMPPAILALAQLLETLLP